MGPVGNDWRRLQALLGRHSGHWWRGGQQGLLRASSIARRCALRLGTRLIIQRLPGAEPVQSAGHTCARWLSCSSSGRGHCCHEPSQHFVMCTQATDGPWQQRLTVGLEKPVTPVRSCPMPGNLPEQALLVHSVLSGPWHNTFPRRQPCITQSTGSWPPACLPHDGLVPQACRGRCT